jgi:ferredoxin
MKIEIDQDKCVAAGQCVLTAPGVFDQRDEDGIVVLLEEAPRQAPNAAVREAAQLCPALAITLHED